MKSNIKKSLLFALTVAVMTVLTVFSVSAKTVTKNKLVYEVSEKTAVLIECKSNAKKIKIPSKVGKYKVTAIGDWAFSGKTKLQSVEIPKTVTKIGKAAFNECSSLKKVIIPSKVKRIYSSAFWYCTSLKTAVIPASVNKFGKNIFEGCDELTAYVVKGSKSEKYIKNQKDIKLAYRYMTSLKLDAESLILSEGEAYSLSVTVKPKKLYNSKVTFSSDNNEVVTVNSKGILTAKTPGTAVITCKAKDGSGKKAVCTVTVKAKASAKAVSAAPVAPAGVTGLKVEAVSDSSVSLSWNAVKDASGYKVYLVRDDGTYEYRWAASSAKAEMKGLQAGREYTFAVKSYRRNYYSSTDSTAYSNGITVKTLPGKVSDITAQEKLIYPDKMTLSWNGAEGADGYNLYMYDKDKGDFVLYESTESLTCQVTGLTSGTEYRFRIKTYSGEEKAEGSFSETFTFCTDYLPTDEAQAAESFISALSETKTCDGSFELYTRYDVSDFDGVSEEISCVEDALSIKERGSYTFENGKADKDGEKISVTDVLYPYGTESGLILPDIMADTVEFGENGSGYDISFTVSSDEAEYIIPVTDTEKLEKEIDGFVLNSFETGDVSVNAKITDGVFEHLTVSVPVKLAFFLGGEKYEITYTVSQNYLFIG